MIYFKKILLFIIILLYKCKSYAVFPFKSFNKCLENENINLNSNIKYISEVFIKNCLTNNIYTEMDIGEPKQTVNILFSMKGSSFYLFEEFCPKEISTFYDINKSITFKNSTICIKYFNNIYSICDIKEKITFYNNINLLSNITLNEANIAFGKGLPDYIKNNDTNNICGYIGFSLMNRDISNLLNRFFLLLKFFKIIDEYTWTFHFFDKNNKNDLFYKINNKNNIHEGFFITGILPHEYANDIFNRTNYKSTLNENRGYSYRWDLKFFEIYFYDYNNNKININNNFQGELDIETNYIISTKEYFNLIKDKFFNDYLNTKICINETVEVGKNFYSITNNYYEVISCDINYFNINEMKKFPSLYFFHLKYNYTFILNYKELFQNIYNRTFFLITTSKNTENFWTFGKLFMKKYQFIFDSDKKTINFYTNKKFDYFNYSNKTSKIKYFIFILVTIIFSILIGIYIGKRKYKIKTNIVSELKDDFNYKSTIDVNNNKEKANQNIEMKSKLVY